MEKPKFIRKNGKVIPIGGKRGGSKDKKAKRDPNSKGARISRTKKRIKKLGKEQSKGDRHALKSLGMSLGAATLLGGANPSRLKLLGAGALLTGSAYQLTKAGKSAVKQHKMVRQLENRRLKNKTGV